MTGHIGKDWWLAGVETWCGRFVTDQMTTASTTDIEVCVAPQHSNCIECITAYDADRGASRDSARLTALELP